MSQAGELAQMVERSLSMREVAGSMPAFSSGLLTADIYSTVLLKGERISTCDFYRYKVI